MLAEQAQAISANSRRKGKGGARGWGLGAEEDPNTQHLDPSPQPPFSYLSAPTSAAGTGTGRALVVAGRRVAVITDSAVGLEAVSRAVGTRPRARRGHVTHPGCWATDRATGLESVGWTVG